jgi:HK97 gp10 family phage protein
MSNVHVDVSQAIALAAEFGAAGPRVVRKADVATRKVRDRAGDLAQANAPVRTGELRASREDFDEGDEHGFAFTARHARFVEFGTSRMGPQPYVWPAADRAERELPDEIEKIADPFD